MSLAIHEFTRKVKRIAKRFHQKGEVATAKAGTVLSLPFFLLCHTLSRSVYSLRKNLSHNWMRDESQLDAVDLALF
jgi:hypothetical protein